MPDLRLSCKASYRHRQVNGMDYAMKWIAQGAEFMRRGEPWRSRTSASDLIRKLNFETYVVFPWIYPRQFRDPMARSMKFALIA